MGVGKKMQIGDLKVDIPIVQGGMGVGISLSSLATAVANEGGIGVISATGIGMLEKALISIRISGKPIREPCGEK